jgi:hypothetical protein
MRIWLTVALLTSAAACGSAQFVERDTSGGTIVLSGLTYQARSDANDKMRGECHGVYTVVGESKLSGDQSRVQYACGRIAGVPDSQLAPPEQDTTMMPGGAPGR